MWKFGLMVYGLVNGWGNFKFLIIMCWKSFVVILFVKDVGECYVVDGGRDGFLGSLGFVD